MQRVGLVSPIYYHFVYVYKKFKVFLSQIASTLKKHWKLNNNIINVAHSLAKTEAQFKISTTVFYIIVKN